MIEGATMTTALLLVLSLYLVGFTDQVTWRSLKQVVENVFAIFECIRRTEKDRLRVCTKRCIELQSDGDATRKSIIVCSVYGGALIITCPDRAVRGSFQIRITFKHLSR